MSTRTEQIFFLYGAMNKDTKISNGYVLGEDEQMLP
jgi:hypothetical protein